MSEKATPTHAKGADPEFCVDCGWLDGSSSAEVRAKHFILWSYQGREPLTAGRISDLLLELDRLAGPAGDEAGATSDNGTRSHAMGANPEACVDCGSLCGPSFVEVRAKHNTLWSHREDLSLSADQIACLLHELDTMRAAGEEVAPTVRNVREIAHAIRQGDENAWERAVSRKPPPAIPLTPIGPPPELDPKVRDSLKLLADGDDEAWLEAVKRNPAAKPPEGEP